MNTSANYSLLLPNLAAMESLAKKLATVLEPGSIIYLQGNLGAGKTTIVRGVINALGHRGAVKSPTYTLVETYTLSKYIINHFDLYRVTDPEELDLIGIREYINANTVCIFEWAEKGDNYIPPADLILELEILSEGRSAIIKACSDLGAGMLNALRDVEP